jgi:hypothetical protein
MFGLRPQELALIVLMLSMVALPAAAIFVLIYLAVRLAIRHEGKNSK